MGDTPAPAVVRSTTYDEQVCGFDAATKATFDSVLTLRWAVKSHPSLAFEDYRRALRAFVALDAVSGDFETWNYFFTGLKRVQIKDFPAHSHTVRPGDEALYAAEQSAAGATEPASA
jgi:hypothetical protein